MSRHSQHGVSLIEAMVAMVIMAFGMLGLVGLQASMRLNADVAKQRAEATRLAQERLEQWRSYGSVAAYDTTVVDAAETTATGPETTNTTYTILTEVTPNTLPANVPPLRQAAVTVSWQDRASEAQSVRLLTQVVGISPVLGGTLSAEGQGTPVRRIQNRSNAIPKGALDQPDGRTSRFVPPNSTGVVWEFNNLTGLITRICDPEFVTCSSTPYALLSGFVRFAHEYDFPPSEDPQSPSFPVGVRGELTVPADQNVECYVEQRPFYVVYYCAVPLDSAQNPPAWSGFFEVHGDTLIVPGSSTDVSPGKYRVCRYTPQDGDTPPVQNIQHPRVYTLVTQSLVNQNYLIISNGNGINATPCPDDGPNPFVFTNTYLHQPQPGS